MALSLKLTLACQEYAVDLNWSAAMVRAGYKPNTAKSHGDKYFAKPEVQAVITQLQSARAIRLEVDADRVVEELESLALFNVADILNQQGDTSFMSVEQFRKLPRSVTAAIKEIHYEESSPFGPPNLKLKFYDKLKAIDLLARHLGVYDVDNSGAVEFTMHMDLGDGPI